MSKVSVIIPTFNRARYLCEAINSVLIQTYNDFEIIVVDDGSTDNTKELLNKYNGKIKYIYQQNQGMSAARNLGINMSDGEYISFLDNDDVWLPEKLKKQIDLLDSNPEIAFVSSDSFVIDAFGSIIKTWGKGTNNYENFESLYEENFIPILTVVARKKYLLDAGLFDEALSVCADYDLWLRLAKKYRFKHISIPLAKYRIHGDNISKNIELRQREREKISNKYVDAKEISFLRRKIRNAKNNYHFANQYYSANKFSRAGICYLKSTLNFPLVGYYYWPKEAENIRFSLPYRILKIYYLAIECFIREIFKKIMNKAMKAALFRITLMAMIFAIYLTQLLKKILWRKTKTISLGLLNIEFFHKEIGIFGGYGQVYKNITDYFNTNDGCFKADVLLTRPMPFTNPRIKRLDNTDVIFHSDIIRPGIINTLKYAKMVNRRNFDLLITMEYYSSYLYTALLLPKTPLIIWIHDPRPKEEWDKIFTVPLAKITDGKDISEQSLCYENKSLMQILKLSSILRRKVIFATSAYSLIAMAKKTYNLTDINPVLLPTPVAIPDIAEITYSSKPSLCFLGRLDPVKRPWIFFELAKRFKDMDFIVAGKTHFPELMDPIIKKYSDVPNLKFLGLVTGKEKDELLKNIWCIINTSIHEALPNSFLESLSYGKPIIACHNPDNLVSRFGVYTGELLNDGIDSDSLNRFSKGIEEILANREKWKKNGMMSINCMKTVYSFNNFQRILKEIHQDHS